MSLEHKPYTLPEVDLSDDDGDPEWAGEDMVWEPDRGMYRWVCPPGVLRNAWDVYKQDWADTVSQYEANPNDFVNCWYYLDNHPAFWTFRQEFERDEWPPNHLQRLEHQYGIQRCVEVTPHRVHPVTLAIDDDESLNTRTRLWYELGKMDLFVKDADGHGTMIKSHWHDTSLDGGADSYEEAIIEIARKVWDNYGNDRMIVDSTSYENGNTAASSIEEAENDNNGTAAEAHAAISTTS